jgi:hypothetical protein
VVELTCLDDNDIRPSSFQYGTRLHLPPPAWANAAVPVIVATKAMVALTISYCLNVIANVLSRNKAPIYESVHTP